MEQCIAFFQEKNYTKNRIGVYKTLWKSGIVPFMEAQGLKVYNPSIGAMFIDTCHYNGRVRPQEREKIRSIQVLDDMLLTGLIRKRCYTPVFHRLDGEIGQEMEKLIQHLTNLRRSSVTISDYRLYLSEFLHHLGTEGVRHKDEIAEKHIVSFILSHPTNKVNIVSALRVLFRFWKEEHILGRDFDQFFESFRVRHPERIPSFFTKDEVMRIEDSISRSSAVGKRNYAMTLLASRLGLRASDIANLRFNQIDWDNNLITLTMQKTRKPYSCHFWLRSAMPSLIISGMDGQRRNLTRCSSQAVPLISEPRSPVYVLPYRMLSLLLGWMSISNITVLIRFATRWQVPCCMRSHHFQ